MLRWLSIKGADLTATLRWRTIPVVVILWTVMGMFFAGVQMMAHVGIR